MKNILGVVFAILIYQIKAQNLVSNPGFELFSECPTKIGELTKATGWFSPNPGTPEFFHLACPMNEANPRSGLGQAGIILFGDYSKTLEYIETKLTEPLKAQNKYCLEFWVRAEDAFMYIDQVGMYLSNEKLSIGQWKPIIQNAQLVSIAEQPITPELGWVRVSKEYIAKGGESYLTIGNFMEDDAHLIHLNEFARSYSPGWNTYFYVDDVRVEKIAPGQSCQSPHEVAVLAPIELPKEYKIDLYFYSDEDELSIGGIDSLMAFMNGISTPALYDWRMTGHTDCKGGESYNLSLSERRLQKVYSIIKLNLPSQNIEMIPKGKTDATNKLDFRDRRVSILVTEKQ
ncbi:MAG: hypothetical protein KDC83_05725 [Flavobacteriales bacterium]|nr:hypothetical protein [Flavobacteriales bacterium]